MRQEYYSVTGWKTKQQAQYNNELIFYTCNTYIQYTLSLKFSQPFSNQRTINIEYSQHSNKTTTFSGFNTMYFLLCSSVHILNILQCCFMYQRIMNRLVSGEHVGKLLNRCLPSQRPMFYLPTLFEITEEKMYIYLSIFSDLLICLASFLTERIRDKNFVDRIKFSV